MAESGFTAVAPLDGGHDRTPFDCGVPALNLYLRNYALQKLVHAKDEAAAEFYRKHGFEPVVDDPLKLFLPVPLSSG